MDPLHNRIRTEISADLLVFLRSLPPNGPFGDLTIYRHSGSLFGFMSSLAPNHHYVVKVRCHTNKPGYDPASWAQEPEEEEDTHDPKPKPKPKPLPHSD